MANVMQNLIFRSEIYVTIADADIESLKFPLHYFDKYLDHMMVKFEQNCMVRITQKKKKKKRGGGKKRKNERK